MLRPPTLPPAPSENSPKAIRSRRPSTWDSLGFEDETTGGSPIGARRDEKLDRSEVRCWG